MQTTEEGCKTASINMQNMYIENRKHIKCIYTRETSIYKTYVYMKNIYAYEKMHLKYTYSAVSISPLPVPASATVRVLSCYTFIVQQLFLEPCREGASVGITAMLGLQGAHNPKSFCFSGGEH